MLISKTDIPEYLCITDQRFQGNNKHEWMSEKKTLPTVIYLPLQCSGFDGGSCGAFTGNLGCL